MVKEENIWKRKIIICAEEREKEENICREERRRSKRGEIIGAGKLLTGQEEGGGEGKCQGSVNNNFWNILNKLPLELTSPTLALTTTSVSSSSMVSSTFLVVRDDGVKNHHYQRQLQTALTRVPDELERR